MQNFSEKLKIFVGFALGMFLVFASWTAIESALLLHEARRSVIGVTKKVNPVLQDLQTASREVANSAKDLADTSKAQKELLTNEKTQRAIGLFLRSGDDLNRTVKKVNIALDQINYDTIPKFNNTLDSTDNIINTSNKIIIKLADKTELILDDTDQAVRELNSLLADPNIRRAIEGVALAASATGHTAIAVEVTAEEVKAAIPELVNNIKSVGNNADLSSKEVLQFLTGLNKPLTRKQKLFKFILEAFVKSSPVILRR